MPMFERCPERESLLAAVERIRPVLEAGAREAEEQRTLPREAVTAMLEADLFRLSAPREYGGFEADPLTQMEVVEAVTRIDTSAGWCLFIGAGSSAMAGAYLPPRAAKQIFDGGSFPIMASPLMPAGTAERIEGGYRVNGRWPFASGVRHSSWIMCCAIVTEGGAPKMGPGGVPEMVSVTTRVKPDAIEDTWHVSGLRGTGSNHYLMQDVFVEDDFVQPFPTAPSFVEGLIFQASLFALVAPLHTAFALGAGRRGLDEITKIAVAKPHFWTQTPIANRASFQRDLGLARVKLDAARLFAIDTIEVIAGAMLERRALLPEEASALRLASSYATDTAAEVVSMAYRHAGASAIYATETLQRYFRDIHAATQHIAASDEAYEFAGRVMMGMKEMHPFFMPRRAPE